MLRHHRASLVIALLAAACVSSTPAFAKGPDPLAVHASPIAAANVDTMPSAVLTAQLVSIAYSHVIGTVIDTASLTVSVSDTRAELTPSGAYLPRAQNAFDRSAISARLSRDRRDSHPVPRVSEKEKITSVQ